MPFVPLAGDCPRAVSRLPASSSLARLTQRGWLAQPAVRVWSLTLLLAALAIGVYAGSVRLIPPVHPPLDVPWAVVALLFCVAELMDVQVHFRRETHAFSLSEVPLVIGLFFLQPAEFLVALLVGSGIAMGARSRGRHPMKLAFNLSDVALNGTLALVIFHGLSNTFVVPGPQAWFAAFAATLTTSVVAAVAIAAAISLSGGAPQFQKLPEMLQFGGLVALANTSLALLAVSILWINSEAIWLLAVPVGTLFIAYRAYVSEKEKHERLELLYESSRILNSSAELDSALVALLGHARTMFRAELAEVVLYARHPNEEALRTRSWHEGEPETMVPVLTLGEERIHSLVRSATAPFFYVAAPGETPSVRQGMVSPLRGEEDLIGYLLIANRLTEGTTFSADDLRLLETLANQAASALEHGHLEQSLAELSRLKEQLKYQAYHDSLTHLPNRSLFLERVTERLDADGDLDLLLGVA